MNVALDEVHYYFSFCFANSYPDVFTYFVAKTI